MTTIKKHFVDNSCSATLMIENDLPWLGVATMTLRTNFHAFPSHLIIEKRFLIVTSCHCAWSFSLKTTTKTCIIVYIYVCIYYISHISGMLQGIGVRPILLTTLTIIWLEHSNIFDIVPLAGGISYHSKCPTSMENLSL